VDYRKVDAALAAALAEVLDGPEPDRGARAAPQKLSVFVHVDPAAAKRERAALAKLGVRAGSLMGGIGTATLSPSQVRELSELPWVRQIRLSQPLDSL
jgi:hypothetical protein